MTFLMGNDIDFFVRCGVKIFNIRIFRVIFYIDFILFFLWGLCSVLSIEVAEERLRERVHLAGLKIVAVPGDGSCLFHAVAAMLSSTEAVLGLRGRTIQEITENEGFYRPFAAGWRWGESLAGRSWAQAVAWHYRPVEGFGDNLSLASIVRLLGIGFRIFSSGAGRAAPLDIGEGVTVRYALAHNPASNHYDATARAAGAAGAGRRSRREHGGGGRGCGGGWAAVGQ
jgi:hypothetical protein